VMARWLALEGDTRTSGARRRLLEAAAGLLVPGRAGDSNQALMELGATLCTPRRPKCLLCPLAAGCRAANQEDPESYPAPRRKREVEKHLLVVAVVEDGPRVLLFRRPEESGLLAGTWELPWVESTEPEAALAARYGGRWSLGPEVARVRHGITHRDLEVQVHRAGLASGGEAAEGPEAGWFDAPGREALPLSSLVGKVLASLPAPVAEAAPSRRRAR